MSNSLDPDQSRHNVGPDLGPSYLHRLSADDTSRQRVEIFCYIIKRLYIQGYNLLKSFFSCLFFAHWVGGGCEVEGGG